MFTLNISLMMVIKTILIYFHVRNPI